MMKKLHLITLINSLVYLIGIIIWNTTSSFFNYGILILVQISLFSSLLLIILNFLRILKHKWKSLIFTVIALIPIINFLTDFNEKVIDLFKPEKELVAIQNWGNKTRNFTIRQENRFEYREQSAVGAEIYKGNYRRNGDTLYLMFDNNKPSFISDSLITGYISERKLRLNLNDRIEDYIISYRKK